MTRKLQSLLEIVIVVGGLAGTPAIVVASLDTIIASVQNEPVVAVAQESPPQSLPVDAGI